MSCFRVHLSTQIPVYQFVNGRQVGEDFTLALGLIHTCEVFE